MITAIQRKRNREGKPWAAMVIEDRIGTIDGWCSPPVTNSLGKRAR